VTGDGALLVLALAVAALLVAARGKTAKSITGWFTVTFPPKGRRSKGRRKH
jgi:hypothetical protein